MIQINMCCSHIMRLKLCQYMLPVIIVHSLCVFVFFLMIRRPPRSTLDRSSAASDVYKRQESYCECSKRFPESRWSASLPLTRPPNASCSRQPPLTPLTPSSQPVSYTHLRAHETVLDIVCRLLLETKHRTNTLYAYSPRIKHTS